MSQSPFSIQSLSPNPASDQVSICYYIGSASSAYLNVTSINTADANNYILDVMSSSTVLNVSNYSPGIYVVSLVRDGQLVDTKNLAIN